MSDEIKHCPFCRKQLPREADKDRKKGFYRVKVFDWCGYENYRWTVAFWNRSEWAFADPGDNDVDTVYEVGDPVDL